jgi:hypothetical protein
MVKKTAFINSADQNKTTIMIKNLPNKYTRSMLVEDLECTMPFSSFDFVYMPLDFHTHSNFGYAFVNLSRSEYVKDFFNIYSNRRLPNIRTSKTCELTFARVQGYHSNVNRLINSPIFSLIEGGSECLPLIFQNGKSIQFKKFCSLYKSGVFKNETKPYRAIRDPNVGPFVDDSLTSIIESLTKGSFHVSESSETLSDFINELENIFTSHDDYKTAPPTAVQDKFSVDDSDFEKLVAFLTSTQS